MNNGIWTPNQQQANLGITIADQGSMVVVMIQSGAMTVQLLPMMPEAAKGFARLICDGVDGAVARRVPVVTAEVTNV